MPLDVLLNSARNQTLSRLCAALALQEPAQAALNMLPEAAAYCRYTDAESTADVVVNSKLQALLARGTAAEMHVGPEAYRGPGVPGRAEGVRGMEGEREGTAGAGGEGEGGTGTGPGGSGHLPLDAFLHALLGPHKDEARTSSSLPALLCKLCTAEFTAQHSTVQCL